MDKVCRIGLVSGWKRLIEKRALAPQCLTLERGRSSPYHDCVIAHKHWK